MSRRGENPLVDLLVDHRKCVYGVESYLCICGEDLPSNSHVRLAEHQAQKIEQFLEAEAVKGMIGNA